MGMEKRHAPGYSKFSEKGNALLSWALNVRGYFVLTFVT